MNKSITYLLSLSLFLLLPSAIKSSRLKQSDGYKSESEEKGNTDSIKDNKRKKTSRCTDLGIVWSKSDQGISLSSLVTNKSYGDCAKVCYKNRRTFDVKNNKIASLFNQNQDLLQGENNKLLGDEKTYVVASGRGSKVIDLYNKMVDKKGLSKDLKFKNSKTVSPFDPIALSCLYIRSSYDEDYYFYKLSKLPFYNKEGKKIGMVQDLFGAGDLKSPYNYIKSSNNNPECKDNVRIINYKDDKNLKDKKMFVRIKLARSDYSLFLCTPNHTKKEILQSAFYAIKGYVPKELKHLIYPKESEHAKMRRGDFFIAPCVDVTAKDRYEDNNKSLTTENGGLLSLYTNIRFKMNHEGIAASSQASVSMSRSLEKAQEKPKNLVFNSPFYIFLFCSTAIKSLKSSYESKSWEKILPLFSVKVDNPCL